MKKSINKNYIPYIISFVAMLVMGLTMSFLVPTWQTPDERQHLRIIAQSVGSRITGQMVNHIDINEEAIIGDYEKMDAEKWLASLMQTKGDYKRQKCLPKKISPLIVKHLPATMGILLGVYLDLPAIWVMQLGEIFALLFYLIMCGLIIYIMPIKKELMLMFMALPMSIHQAASINYDAVMIPLCLFFIAYNLYLRYEKEHVGWIDFLIEILVLGIVAYIKPPYIFLGLVALLIPIEKVQLKLFKLEIKGQNLKKWRLPIYAIGIVAIAIVIYVFRDNYWINILAGLALEWVRTVYLLLKTIYTWGAFLMTSSVGQFGWLDSKLPFWLVIIAYIIMIVVSIFDDKKEEADNDIIGKAILIVSFIVLTLIVMFSMVDHTITITLFGGEGVNDTYNIRSALYYIPYIGGLQGRYFLPVLPLLFLGLPQIKIKNVQWKTWLVVAFQIVAFVISVNVLLHRYWIG